MWKYNNKIKYGDCVRLKSYLQIKHDWIDRFGNFGKVAKTQTIQYIDKFKNTIFICIPNEYSLGTYGDYIENYGIQSFVTVINGKIIRVNTFSVYFCVKEDDDKCGKADK